MEPALRAVCKDVRIGKILIQTNQDTGEPEVQNPSVLLKQSAKHGRLFLFQPFSNVSHRGPLYSADLTSLSAPLPPSTERHQRRSRDSHGLHRVHRRRRHDGRPRSAGRESLVAQKSIKGLFSSGVLMPAARVQDHDVQEDKILLVSLLMAEMGVHSVAYAFPQVKIITTAVDKKVNHLFHIIPGIGEQQKDTSAQARAHARATQPFNGHVSAMLGNFGDRYFGTDAPPDWSDEDMDEPSY